MTESKPLLPALQALGIDEKDIKPELKTAQITGISYDSRAVQKGHAFVCIEGLKMDGNKFIPDALAKGATCIITQQKQDATVPAVVVPDTKLALALLADQFYGNPSAKLRLIGVTGTNGKTTTTHLIEHIILRHGEKIGIVGTLGARYSAEDGTMRSVDLHHTTPQASDLQELLGDMVSKKQKFVAMEVSSHALALNRVAGCQFAVAALTNVTQDHLDFHKTMEHYWNSKRHLFEMLSESKQQNKRAVLNADDPLANEFRKAVKPPTAVWTYGWNAPADAHVISCDFDFKGSRLKLATPAGEVSLRLRLNGRFNVYNTMAALLICLSEGVPLETCREALESFTGVPGRFETVFGSASDDAKEPLCIVDYAHTPDGLQNILSSARAIVPSDGKLLVVFGCGGDRDASKRPQMGEIAERLADVVIVSSDNPRSEDPQQIIAAILAGIKRMKFVQVEPDRARAIRMAVQQAGDRDVVVIAGKGHETYQILADKTIDFDDRIEVREALLERGGALRR